MIGNKKEIYIRISESSQKVQNQSYGNLIYIHRFTGNEDTSLAAFLEWISRKGYLIGHKDIGKETYRFLRNLPLRDHEFTFSRASDNDKWLWFANPDHQSLRLFEPSSVNFPQAKPVELQFQGESLPQQLHYWLRDL